MALYFLDSCLSTPDGQDGFSAKFGELSEYLKVPGVYGLEIYHKLKKGSL